MLMDVLLVRPKPDRETIGLQHVMICEPLELEYLVSNVPDELRSSVRVEIIDMILEKESYESILTRLKPSLVVFTGYITHVGIIKSMCAVAKGLVPGILTGVGGVHAEVVAQDFDAAEIDFVYSQNGIEGFNETLRGILANRNVDEIKATLDEMGDKKTSFSYKHPDRSAVSNYRQGYYYMFHSPCALIKTSFLAAHITVIFASAKRLQAELTSQRRSRMWSMNLLRLLRKRSTLLTMTSSTARQGSGIF